MKKSKEITGIYNELEGSIDNIAVLIKQYHKKIKKEYTILLIEEKYKLLQNIAENENLNLDELKSKYLKPKELLNINTISITTETESSEELLDKIDIKGEIYYYENKEKGKVYNSEYNEVGIYKNNAFIMN
jgi:hypothetical protein